MPARFLISGPKVRVLVNLKFSDLASHSATPTRPTTPAKIASTFTCQGAIETLGLSDAVLKERPPQVGAAEIRVRQAEQRRTRARGVARARTRGTGLGCARGRRGLVELPCPSLTRPRMHRVIGRSTSVRDYRAVQTLLARRARVGRPRAARPRRARAHRLHAARASVPFSTIP